MLTGLFCISSSRQLPLLSPRANFCSWWVRVVALSAVKKALVYFRDEQDLKQHQDTAARTFLGMIALQVCFVPAFRLSLSFFSPLLSKNTYACWADYLESDGEVSPILLLVFTWYLTVLLLLFAT
jgi:hypothetical protein